MTRRTLALGTVGAGDFLLNLDGSGSYTMNLHLAEGVTAFCRTSVFYQAGSEPKRISCGSPENGDWIEFRVNEKTWCEAKNSDENIARADLETMTGGGWGYTTTRQFDVWLVKEGAVPPARIGKTRLSVSRKTAWTEVEGILGSAVLNTGGAAEQGALVKLHTLALAAGRYTLYVQWVVSSSPITFPGAVNVVRVEKLQYLDGTTWKDVPTPFYVAKDTTLSFRAVPDPAGAPWPTGKPVWGGSASGTSGTASVTFATVGSQTVSAECGNTVTVTIVVLELTQTPTTTTRGQNATFTIVGGAVAANVSDWNFVFDATTTARPGNNQDLTWQGTLVKGGTVSVAAHGVLLSVAASVASRNWTDDFTPDPITENPGQGIQNLPPNPTAFDHLGYYHITPPGLALPVSSQVGTGPNQGYNYTIRGLPGPFVCSADINHAAFTAGSDFALAQGNSPNEPSWQTVLDAVRRHEGIDRGRPSHHQQGQDHAAAHPMNPWAEAEVSHVNAESNAAFENRVRTYLIATQTATCNAATGTEPSAITADLVYPDPDAVQAGKTRINVGETTTLTVTGTGGKQPAGTLTWSSGDVTVVSVVQTGATTANATGQGLGWAEVGVDVAEDGESRSVRIDVVAP